MLLCATKKSFTLIELLIVVMILGLLAGITFPSFSNSFANLQLNNSVRDISCLMKYAREKAIMQRKKYRLEFDIAEKRYWLSREEDPINAPNQFKKLTTGIEDKKLPQNISVKKILFPIGISKFSHSYVSFYPDGSIDAADIYLANKKGETAVISTETFGRIEVSQSKVKYQE